MNSDSKRFSLNDIDWVKIGKGLLIALGGALLTYMTQIITDINFGNYTLLIMAFWSSIVNIVRKWLIDHTPKQPETIQPE